MSTLYRRSAFTTLLIVASCVLLSSPVQAVSAADAVDTTDDKQPLNVLLIVADGLCHPTNDDGIPNIDRLYRQGFQFFDAYSQGSPDMNVKRSFCAMLQTGQSVWHAQNSDYSKRYLPQMFGDAGYRTLRSGESRDTCNAANAQYQHSYVSDDRQSGSLKWHADNAIRLIEQSDDDERPFMIQLSLPSTLGSNFCTKQEQIDTQIGRLLDALHEQQLDNNTLIVLISRESCSEELTNLPESSHSLSIVFVGPNVPKGQSFALIYLHDISPTLCDYAGIETSGTVDGRSIRPVIEGNRATFHDYLYRCNGSSFRIIHNDRYKMTKYNINGVKGMDLLDLAKGPFEQKDLSTDPKYADTLKQLDADLDRAAELYDDPIDIDADMPVRPVGPTRKFSGNGPAPTPGRAITADDKGAFTLEPHDAKIYGSSLRYQSDRPNLGSWSNMADYPEFTLSGVKPGDYRIDFTYGSTGQQPYTISIGDSKIEAATNLTDGILNYKTYDVGTVNLSAATVKLTIKPTKPLKGALMNYRSIRITPVK